MTNKLIFFVDDDKMMLNLMEYTFKCKDGFEVKSYLSGEECVENLFLKPQLIVLDHILGDDESRAMSGLDTLKRITKLNNNIPVIILSREKSNRLIDKFIKSGAKRYIIKDDFFIDTLIETINEHFTIN